MEAFFSRTRKPEVVGLLKSFHYIGSQCADPAMTFVWRRGGGLFGDCGEPCAAALFAPPASFSWGSNAIELTRLVRDETAMPPLTRFLSECFREIKSDGRYELVVSYADPAAGHHGGVYQAGNWIYIGPSSSKTVYIHKESGKRSSQRSFDQSNYDPTEWTKTKSCPKHTYVYPLSKRMRRAWKDKSIPYPKPTI